MELGLSDQAQRPSRTGGDGGRTSNPTSSHSDAPQLRTPDPSTPGIPTPEKSDPFRSTLPDVFAPGPSRCEREVASLLRRQDSGETAITEVPHLVALHARGHEVAYDHLPQDLPGEKTWRCAVSAAERVVREVFSGDVQAAAAYVVWAWDREVARARGPKKRPRPVGWRLVFGPMVSDYAIHVRDLARKAA